MNTLANQVPVDLKIHRIDLLFGFMRKTQSGKIEAKLKDSVFRSLSMRDITRLCKAATLERRKFNDKILRAGEENENLYLVVEGSCLIKNGGNFFAEIPEGYFIGEISHFNGVPASADVVSRGHLEYLSWDRKSLNKLFSIRPGLKSRFYKVLIQHMANRVQSTTAKIPIS